MKTIAPFFLAVATLALTSCATSNQAGGGNAATETKMGPHSGQKFVILHRRGGLRAAEVAGPTSAASLALVITVEQKMSGDQQTIIARASAHRDGPNGLLEGVDGLRAHVLQPADFGTEPRKTGAADITHTVSAPGGKYRTVVAEASIKSTEWGDEKVELTIPGNQ